MSEKARQHKTNKMNTPRHSAFTYSTTSNNKQQHSNPMKMRKVSFVCNFFVCVPCCTAPSEWASSRRKKRRLNKCEINRTVSFDFRTYLKRVVSMCKCIGNVRRDVPRSISTTAQALNSIWIEMFRSVHTRKIHPPNEFWTSHFVWMLQISFQHSCFFSLCYGILCGSLVRLQF